MLKTLLKDSGVIEKDGIYVANEIAERTVWDELAAENPTHAVISAKNEEEAKKKSEDQIIDIQQHLKSDDVLLDFGTGYGRVAKYLLPKMQLGGYIGIDSAYEMLSIFKNRYDKSDSEQMTPALFLNADIHTVPLKDNSVDVAIVCAVFLHNHKDTVKKSISELKRVLKPGGKVLVYSSFPYGISIMGLQGHFYQILLNLMGKPFKNGPVRYYSKREILRLFSDYSEIELHPYGFAILPKTLIFLPSFLEKIYRVGIANPVNRFLEKISPNNLKPHAASFYDVVAKK